MTAPSVPAPTAGAGPRPDNQPPACRWWIGHRYCGITEGVRRYAPGHRCPAHTPAALKEAAS